MAEKRLPLRYMLGGAALALVIAGCGSTSEQRQAVPTADIAQGTPEGQIPVFSPTAVAGNSEQAAVATEVPEVEIPHINLQGEPGIVALTDVQKDELRNIITTDPEAQDVYNKTIKKEADRVLAEGLAPNPVEQILVTSDQPQATIDAGKKALLDMQLAYKLAYAATVEPENTQYTDKAKEYVLAWARTNQSTGNPINETNFDRMWIAYDLIKESLSDGEREEVLRWIDSVAQKQMQTELTLGNTGINNWRNHKNKIVFFAGILTGNQNTIDAALTDYQHHMDDFYNADGSTYDMDERHALVYQTYGVLPSVEMSRVYALNGGGNLYNLKNRKGGSIAASVDYVLPYVRGEQQHIEFDGTTVQSDKKRTDYLKPWDPKNAGPLLESAAFFNPILVRDLAIASGSSNQLYPSFNTAVYAAQRKPQQ